MHQVLKWHISFSFHIWRKYKKQNKFIYTLIEFHRSFPVTRTHLLSITRILWITTNDPCIPDTFVFTRKGCLAINLLNLVFSWNCTVSEVSTVSYPNVPVVELLCYPYFFTTACWPIISIPLIHGMGATMLQYAGDLIASKTTDSIAIQPWADGDTIMGKCFG